MSGKHIVVLHSGGLDSTIMFELAKRETNNVTAVYFDIGHEYAYKEKACLPEGTHIHDMTWFQATGRGKEGNAMANIFIPGRNMMLATIAACKYVPDEIWMGALMGEIHAQATDKNEKFRDMQTELFDYVLSPFGCVRLVYPFVDRGWGKLQVTEWGVANGFGPAISASSSCMSGESGACGRCGVCIRRAGIFPQVGLPDDDFNVDPWSAPENRNMIRGLLEAEHNQDDSHYDRYRREEIIPTLLARTGKTVEELLAEYSK